MKRYRLTEKRKRIYKGLGITIAFSWLTFASIHTFYSIVLPWVHSKIF